MTVIYYHHCCLPMNVVIIRRPLDHAWITSPFCTEAAPCGICAFSSPGIIFTQSQINTLIMKIQGPLEQYEYLYREN